MASCFPGRWFRFRFRAGWLLDTIAFRADDVVVVKQESFADERLVAFVARETAAVPVSTFKRYVPRAFRSET